MNAYEKMIEKIKEKYAIFQHGILTTPEIVFHPEVRRICETNQCGKYGQTWCCPPALGTYETCRKQTLAYERAFVFTGKYDLEDSYDFEGMMAASEQFRQMCCGIRRDWTARFGDCALYATGGCRHCRECTYPDAPCRFPQEMIQSLEGLGILVNRLAETLQINYINGKDTVTYFGMILFP